MGEKRTGSEKQAAYGLRKIEETKAKRLRDGKWLCTKCQQYKPFSAYRMRSDKPNYSPSWCIECTKEATRQYAKKISTKTAELRAMKKAKNAEARRAALLSQMLKCERCGETKPRSEWPIERGSASGNFPGKTRKYCCSNQKRTEAEVANDLAERMKTCTSCGIRKSFNDFSPNKNARDGRQTTCKPCRSAKVHSGEWHGASRRQETIDARSDGTITTEMMRERFAVKICPCCDGHMDRDDKVLDHIVPLKLGGMHSASNVTVMCRYCNAAKSAHHPSRWLQLLKPEAAARMREHYSKMGLNF